MNCFITARLLVFSLIMIRSFVRLRMETSKAQLGARFKTKMVVGAMAISLLPVIFMFFMSYSLLNRTLGRWFPRPLEIASEETQKMFNDIGRGALPRLHTLGYQAAMHATETPQSLATFPDSGVGCRLDLRCRWEISKRRSGVRGPAGKPLEGTCTVSGVHGTLQNSLPSGVESGRRKTTVILPPECL